MGADQTHKFISFILLIWRRFPAVEVIVVTWRVYFSGTDPRCKSKYRITPDNIIFRCNPQQWFYFLSISERSPDRHK